MAEACGDPLTGAALPNSAAAASSPSKSGLSPWQAETSFTGALRAGGLCAPFVAARPPRWLPARRIQRCASLEAVLAVLALRLLCRLP